MHRAREPVLTERQQKLWLRANFKDATDRDIVSVCLLQNKRKIDITY